MKKTLKLIGIIAIMALIITAGMTSCDGLLGEEEEEFVFAGELSISPSTGTIYVGDKLTASFFSSNTTAEEKAVVFQWRKADSSEDGKLEIASNEFTPTEAGSYFVRVVSQKDPSQNKDSGLVSVVVHPLADFLGTWKTTQKFSIAGAPGTHDETITITRTKIRLDSTWDGKNAQGQVGTPYAAGHDTEAPFEYFEYTYATTDPWVALTDNDLKFTPYQGTEQTAAKAFKLNFDVAQNKTKGYTLGLESIYLYLTSGGSVVMYRGSPNAAPATGVTVLARNYAKQ